MVDGHKIRELREAAGLTVKKFAEILCVSQPFISRVELGDKQPSVAILKRMADYFELHMEDFIKTSVQ